MKYEKLKELPDWVQDIHAAAERLSEATLEVPADRYAAVKRLRDDAEALWLAETGHPTITFATVKP